MKIKMPKEVINFMYANGTIVNDGTRTFINLPQWFELTEDEDVYDVIFGKDLTGYASDVAARLIIEHDHFIIENPIDYKKQ